MFSDSSDIESDDVAVIRHSILVPSEHFPFIQSLADFAKQACGWSGSLKKYLFAQTHDNTFAAIALCPPVAVALQEGCETKEYSAVATGGASLTKCQALAIQALLKKLHADGLIQKFSPTPTPRVWLPCIEVCLPGGSTHHIPLFIRESQISSYPLLKAPESHPILYIHRSEQLSEFGVGGKDVLMQHLFPKSTTGSEGQSSELQGAVVGFDLEWRPKGPHIDRMQQLGSFQGEAAPVSVIQLSSQHATVVVNAFALGRSMKPHSTAHEASATGAAIVQPVFGNQELVKVGLGCYEDLRRLKLMLPQCEFPNTQDLKEIAESVGLQKQGLRSLLAATLRYRLSKSDQCSDWQQIELTPLQVEYAALDAFATRKVYEFLLEVQAAVAAGNSKRVPHKNVDQVLRQLPQLLQNALASGAIDSDHKAKHASQPFAPPQRTPPRYRAGAGRGRRSANTPPARYAADTAGQHADTGWDGADHTGRQQHGQGRGAHRDRGWAPGRGRDAGDRDNGGGARWGTGGAGRHGRGRGRACNHVDLASPSAEDTLAGNVHDMHVDAPHGCRREGRGWGRGNEDMNGQHMQHTPGCDSPDIDHGDHNTEQGGGWKDGSRKRRARRRGRGRHNDENEQYDRQVAMCMHESYKSYITHMSGRGRGGRGGHNRVPDAGLAVGESAGYNEPRGGLGSGSNSFHACSNVDTDGWGQGRGDGQGRGRGRGRVAPQQHGSEQGGGGRRSKNRCAHGRGGMTYSSNQTWGPQAFHHTWGDRSQHAAPQFGERCRERSCGQAGGPNRKERERSPHRMGRRRQTQRNRMRGKWEDSRSKGQDDVNDCYKVPDGEPFDPREIPTALYVASEKEAQRQFAEQPPAEVVALSSVKTSGRLPVATAKFSRFDVMEHYFASVEAVAQDGDDGWVKAWGITELKESAYYKELLSHFGGTD